LRRLVFIAATTALGSLAIHMFVPAMPSASRDLGAPPGELQLALSLYLVGLGASQLAAGPLADRHGRRLMLLAGTWLFAAGSALCWAAPSVEMLLVGRIVQAIGASGGLVAGRAMVGDRGDAGRGDMAILTGLTLFSPMIAPVLGSLITATLGWRAIFALLATVSLASAIGIGLWLPRTPALARPQTTGLLGQWGAVLADRGFRANLAVATLLTAGLYIFLAVSPFLLVGRYHADPARIGLFYGMIAVGASAGAFTAGRLARRWSAAATIRIGSAISAAGALAGLVGTLARIDSPWALILPMIAYTIGGGLIGPNAMMLAIGRSEGRVGTAVSLYGALQMGGNAIATLAIALVTIHDPRISAAIIAMLACTALAVGFGRAIRC
jgi:DHA1 family bicyclomycin/chloramphenicol resistance-like MFS transporter